MLNLEGLTQAGLVEGDGQYEITATCSDHPPLCCLDGEMVRNGTKRVMFMDTPMHGKKVGIWVPRQRWKCKKCGETSYTDIPHMHERHRMTDRLYRYICDNGAKRSWTALAQEIGIDAQTISDIWNKWADAVLFCCGADDLDDALLSNFGIHVRMMACSIASASFIGRRPFGFFCFSSR